MAKRKTKGASTHFEHFVHFVKGSYEKEADRISLQGIHDVYLDSHHQNRVIRDCLLKY